MNGRNAKTAAAARAALENEQITRERVDALEQWATKFTRLSLWGRLKWLLSGR